MQSLKDKILAEEGVKELKQKAANKKKQIAQEKYDKQVMIGKLRALILAYNKVSVLYANTLQAKGKGQAEKILAKLKLPSLETLMKGDADDPIRRATK